RTISILGQAVRMPVSISSSISSCARSERILVGDQNLGGRMILMSPVYSWLITERARLARLLSGGTSSSGLRKIVLLALSHPLKVASEACWIASMGAICLRVSLAKGSARGFAWLTI